MLPCQVSSPTDVSRTAPQPFLSYPPAVHQGMNLPARTSQHCFTMLIPPETIRTLRAGQGPLYRCRVTSPEGAFILGCGVGGRKSQNRMEAITPRSFMLAGCWKGAVVLAFQELTKQGT